MDGEKLRDPGSQLRALSTAFQFSSQKTRGRLKFSQVHCSLIVKGLKLKQTVLSKSESKFNLRKGGSGDHRPAGHSLATLKLTGHFCPWPHSLPPLLSLLQPQLPPRTALGSSGLGLWALWLWYPGTRRYKAHTPLITRMSCP